MEYLIYLGVLVICIILYVWVLPRLLGLKARMSGSCEPSSAATKPETHGSGR